jgi:hypothetical protein
VRVSPRRRLRNRAAALTLARTGISHGDVYGHNIMTRADGAALLGDFGAATIYRSAAAGEGVGAETALQLQRIEVRALGVLMLELLSIVEGGGGGGCGASRLSLVAESCVNECATNGRCSPPSSSSCSSCGQTHFETLRPRPTAEEPFNIEFIVSHLAAADAAFPAAFIRMEVLGQHM